MRQPGAYGCPGGGGWGADDPSNIAITFRLSSLGMMFELVYD